MTTTSNAFDTRIPLVLEYLCPVKLWEPETDLTEFYDCNGPQYGGYDVLKCWKMELKHTLMNTGFEECANAPSMYVRTNPPTHAIVSVHVDDPIIRCKRKNDGSSELDEIYEELKKHYLVKELQNLTPGYPIDYLSMKLTVGLSKNIRIDNDSKVEKMLLDAGLSDCNSVKVPLSKQHLVDII